MPNKSVIEKLIDSASLTVLVIGVFVFIIGASGGLPIGNPPLQVTDIVWRILLGIMGLTFVGTGLLLILRENKSKTIEKKIVSSIKSPGTVNKSLKNFWDALDNEVFVVYGIENEHLSNPEAEGLQHPSVSLNDLSTTFRIVEYISRMYSWFGHF